MLENTTREPDGRLLVPLTWNNSNSHLLSQNYKLSIQILKSSFAKLSSDPLKLKLYNDVINEQRSMGIIEKIENVDQFIKEHPDCAFLPHMGVFRLDHESTKCRVVFLSNLSEKGCDKLSHNQTILPGPCLNHKIATAVMLLRFDRYLLSFDVKKTFLMIKLREVDQNRLMFLWYNDINNNDFSIVAYRNLRLSFGLRCSPTILMLGLFKILMLDSSGDKRIEELKRSLYNTFYMDNGYYSSNSPEELVFAYEQLNKIFSPYKFELQQFATNLPMLLRDMDECSEANTPVETKLLGVT